MKLYICWGTFPSPRPGGHPCRNAHHALRDAGHEFETVKAHGLGLLPDALNGSRRAEVKQLSGDPWVPLLVLDDGTTVKGSKEIVAWAQANAPASASV